MCIAIPGPFGSSGPRTRFGRFLRDHPAGLGAGAAGLIILIAMIGLLIGPAQGPHWPWPLVPQGLITLLTAGLLALVPRHCGVSALGYLGHWMLAAGTVGAGLMVAAGTAAGSCWIVAIGLGAMLLTLGAAARSLSWQLSWCHQRVAAPLRLAPTAALTGTGATLVVGLATPASAMTLAAGAGLVALCACIALAVGLREAIQPPDFG